MHNKPSISQTLLLANMYINPVLTAPVGPDGQPLAMSHDDVQDHYEVRHGAMGRGSGGWGARGAAAWRAWRPHAGAAVRARAALSPRPSPSPTSTRRTCK
jgi:hypothetical protein